jgi:hypothetical protein
VPIPPRRPDLPRFPPFPELSLTRGGSPCHVRAATADHVHVYCTGRGTHEEAKLPPPLQLVADGGQVGIVWDSRRGAAPVTQFRAEDGQQTFEFNCPRCPTHLKRRGDRLARAALALAGLQGITGDDNTPVRLDISMIERA